MKHKSNSDSKLIIMNVFEERPGRQNALKIDELEKLTGLSNREIRATISQSRKEGVLILSSCTAKPYGYYLAKSPEEIGEGIGDLISRVKDLNETIRGIRKGAERQFGNQFKLELEELLRDDTG